MNLTLNANTEYPYGIMKHYGRNRGDVARYVERNLWNLPEDHVLIITIELGKSEGCYVCTATDLSSDDTQIQISCSEGLGISERGRQDG